MSRNSGSNTFLLFYKLLIPGIISFFGPMLLEVFGIHSTHFQSSVVIFGALVGLGAAYGYAKAPRKSHKQVEQAKKDKKTAERKATQASEEKEEAEEKMEEALEKAEEEEEKREELEESVKERQEDMTEEINEKAEKRAQELAEEKAEERLQKWKEEERENIARENDLRNLAYVGKVRNEAERKVEQMREKLKKLTELVIEDEELIEVLNSGPMTEDRFKVLLKASKDPEIREELEQIQKVKGNVDLWIEQKAQELEEKEESEKGTERGKAMEGEPEEETPEETGIDPSEIFGEVEPEEGDLSEKERYFRRLEDEKLNTTQNDIIRCAKKGLTSSREIAEKLNLNPDTVRRNYKPLREEELLEAGRKGISLTDRGEEYAEYLTG